MANILEAAMLICFGLSWPINIVKSVKTKSTKGKSIAFLFMISFGYIAGIGAKIIRGEINWVFVLYILNIVLVLADAVLYFINKNRENKQIAE